VSTTATPSIPPPSKCTKIVGGWGFAQTPLRYLTALPRPISWIKRPTFKGRGGKKEGKRRKGEGREREELWTLTVLESD